MTNVPEYEIWFYFNVDDENPSVSNEALPKCFNRLFLIERTHDGGRSPKKTLN